MDKSKCEFLQDLLNECEQERLEFLNNNFTQVECPNCQSLTLQKIGEKNILCLCNIDINSQP